MANQRPAFPFPVHFLSFAFVIILHVTMLSGFRLNPLSSFKPANLARGVTSLFSNGLTPKYDRPKPFSTQAATTVPVKTMIFMDGTWMYYSLFQGRVEDSRCPIARKFGDSWQKTHRVDWSAIPQIVARNLGEQLNARKLNNVSPVVDITRCNVFTSQRADTVPNSPRDKMLADFYKNNFDVHRYVTANHQEKCVDISLAVEMLYMATVPNAYEIACIITGDKDFIPAMQKTRLMGKRVALCSMRNGCNADLVAEQAQLRDFEVIYLDEYLDEIIVPIVKQGSNSKTKELLEMFVEILSRDPTSHYSARDLGRELQTLRIDHTVALTVVKKEYLSVRSFVDHFPQLFAVHRGDTKTNFSITLQPDYKQQLQSVFEKLAVVGDNSSAAGSSAGEDSSIDIEQGKHYRDTLLYANTTGTGTPGVKSSRSSSSASDGSGSGGSTKATASTGGGAKVLKQKVVALKDIPHEDIAKIKESLVGLVANYLETCTAVEANSRDLGRYLLTVPYPGYENALVALKSASGKMISFLLAHKQHFEVGKVDKSTKGNSFPVRLAGAGGSADSESSADSSGIDGGCYGGYSSSSSDSSYGSGYSDSGRGDESVDDASVSTETTTTDDYTLSTTTSDTALFKNFKVAALREELQARGLSTEGKKGELLQRLVETGAEHQ